MGWSSPVVWGDRIFVTAVVSTRPPEPPKPGLYFGGERPTPTDEHRWMVYAIDFATGKTRVGARSPPRDPRAVAAPQEQLRLRNAGHRWRARLRVVRQRRLVRLSSGRHAGLAAQVAGARNAQRLGHGGVSRSASGPSRTSSPTTRRTRTWRRSRPPPGRNCGGSRAPKETNWATPYIWQHAQRTEIVTAATSGIRSYDLGGRPLWELKGMSTHRDPDAVRERWSALRDVRLRRRHSIVRPMRSSRARRAISRLARPASATSSSRGISRRPDPTTRRRSSTAASTTRCSIAASSPRTTRGREKNSMAGSASRRRASWRSRPLRGRATERSSP